MAARTRILDAIKAGDPLGIRVNLTLEIEQRTIKDGSGDSLDAVICALQASWGQQQGKPRYGLPPDVDAVEGWIVTAR
jgi:predicted RNase H-like nuclease